MPEGQEHHESIAMTMAVSFGCFDQLLDLIDRQVLPGAKFSIFGSSWRDCSIFSGWRDRTQAWFDHEKSPSRLPHCSIHSHFMNSCEPQSRNPTDKKTNEEQIVWSRLTPANQCPESPYPHHAIV